MSKRVRDNNLDTRAAREKLKIRAKPYWRAIGPGLHVGYRKGEKARRWVARLYAGDRHYLVESIGHADDIHDADGVHVLTFWQAQERARHLAKERAGETPLGPYTVRHAIKDYVEHLKGRASHRDTELRLDAYVPASLADTDVAKLTKKDLVAWHRSLAKVPPRARTKKGAPKQRHIDVDLKDPEVMRRRQVSANRILGQLRAALNYAFKEDKVASDKAWRGIKPFANVNVAAVRYLTTAEAQRLINASDGDFRVLLQAALQTGCRYQELARLRVKDLIRDSGTLLIRQSKSGRSRHVVLTDEGLEFFRQLAAGRAGDEPLLGRQWLASHQTRPMRQVCIQAKIEPRINFHGLRHTWASLAVMNGTPLMVVARNLGHADTRMVEKHYGHLAESYVADEVRKGAPRFGLVKASNVRSFDV